MTTISTDIRHGFRMLRRNPAFSALVILVLALGIGANSAIFSVVNAVLLEPLPFDEPDRLVTIWQTDLEEGNMRFRVSYPNVEDWRRECSAFEAIAALCFRSKTFYGQEYPVEIDGVCASANLFRLLRIQPMLGRTFSEQEERDRITDRVILGHDFWRQHCRSNPDIVGTSIRFNDRSCTVIGVLPDIRFPGEDAPRSGP
jgi:putative ABC transport system permease protein